MSALLVLGAKKWLGNTTVNIHDLYNQPVLVQKHVDKAFPP